MDAKTPDPVDFRQGQRQQWNSAATGWRKWSELIDEAASGVSERLVELAGVRDGSRVLDVAAGYGEPSLTAARRAGADGRVVATDISAEMLAFGRERANGALLHDAGKIRVPNEIINKAGPLDEAEREIIQAPNDRGPAASRTRRRAAQRRGRGRARLARALGRARLP